MQRRDDPAAGRDGRLLAFTLVVLAIGLSVVLRVAPRLWGASPEAVTIWHLMPVGALGLFAGARLRSWWVLLAPGLAMVLSDLLLIKPLADAGYHAFGWGTPVIYASYTLYAVLGRVLADKPWPATAFGGAVIGSVQFFLITNFLAWLVNEGNLYPRTLAGLVECYAAGLAFVDKTTGVTRIPFFANTLLGDLLYSGLLFGAYHAVLWALGRRHASQPA
jgi:hypothetical protein